MKNDQIETLKKEILEVKKNIRIINAQRPPASDFKAFREWEIKVYEESCKGYKVREKIREAGLFDYFFDNGWF